MGFLLFVSYRICLKLYLRGRKDKFYSLREKEVVFCLNLMEFYFFYLMVIYIYKVILGRIWMKMFNSCKLIYMWFRRI